MAKPDRRFYELACARLGCPPSRTVFVDDKQSCVDGARAAGLHAVRHHENAQTIAALQAILNTRRLDPEPEHGPPRVRPGYRSTERSGQEQQQNAHTRGGNDAEASYGAACGSAPDPSIGSRRLSR